MPVIIIARGSLSGGLATAERVAKQLDLPAVGREALLEKAASFGAPGPRIAQLLDTSPTFWDRFQESPEVYVTFMEAAMCQVAIDGRLVYHGHFGKELLVGVSNILRVRVIAPMSYRVSAAMQERRVDADAALAYIKRTDEDRLKRGRQLFGVDWTDPALYDIVLNLDQLTEDMAAEVIVQTVRLPRFQDDAELVRQMRNRALATAVKVALLGNGWLVDVSADGDTVRLKGKVHLLPADQLDDIERIARAVDGVRTVESQVEVVRVPPVTPY
jgi:cytidylate kinase